MTQAPSEEAPLLDTLDLVVITAVAAVGLWVLVKRMLTKPPPPKPIRLKHAENARPRGAAAPVTSPPAWAPARPR